jgi:hypothetical protein
MLQQQQLPIQQMKKNQRYKIKLEQDVANGLDLIISIWPRTISTKTTEGRQIPVLLQSQSHILENILDILLSWLYFV